MTGLTNEPSFYTYLCLSCKYGYNGKVKRLSHVVSPDPTYTHADNAYGISECALMDRCL